MSDVSRLPSATTDHWRWQQQGACRSADAAVFFHPDFERAVNRDERDARAKAVCARCPVLERCREHALTAQEAYGTWGGLDELERRDMIRTLRRGERRGVRTA